MVMLKINLYYKVYGDPKLFRNAGRLTDRQKFCCGTYATSSSIWGDGMPKNKNYNYGPIITTQSSVENSKFLPRFHPFPVFLEAIEGSDCRKSHPSHTDPPTSSSIAQIPSRNAARSLSVI